jgi:hypothetical protein
MPWFQCINAQCRHRFRSRGSIGDPARDSRLYDEESLCLECGSRARRIPDPMTAQEKWSTPTIQPVDRASPELAPAGGAGEGRSCLYLAVLVSSLLLLSIITWWLLH